MNELKMLGRLASVTCQFWYHVACYRHTGVRISDHDAGYWSACEPRFPWLPLLVSWKPELRDRWRDVPVGALDSHGVPYYHRMLEASTTEEAGDLLELARLTVSADHDRA
jgi:hypothetical protein